MKIKNSISKHIGNRKGNSSIILMLLMTSLAALMSISVDAGFLYFEENKLQNAVDAIALASVANFDQGEPAMLEEAFKYAELNGVALELLTITIAEDQKKVSVAATKQVGLYFAKVFNIMDATVDARATAIVGNITGVRGLRPLAVEQQDFVLGQSYSLKRGGGSGYCGNYGALALGGSGASNYRNNLKYGYFGTVGMGDMVEIGDEVDTEPGNMAGPTLEGITYILESDTQDHSDGDITKLEANCPRVIKIPIVDSLSVPGRKTVQIVGFAAFFLEDVIDNDSKTEITGKFIRKLDSGEIGETASDFGLYGIKLVE